ncbi:MAG: redoxin domain-containing protein [Phycisphaerales bacterium]|nr:redoxin domain-containing protein [Phycisphaerales bacterium]
MHTFKQHFAALTAITLSAAAIAAPVKREASEHRDKLTGMETKPFDRAAIADLTDWTHAGVLDESNTKGRVVVLAILSSSDSNSIMALTKLARMHRDYADQGLTIAVIHPEFGFEDMQSKVESGRVTLPVAKDTNNTFVKSMHTDDYPDMYIIDRAGNLRYADIDKNALKAAITNLISETPETAAANAALQAQGLEPTPAEPKSSPAPTTTPAAAPSNNTPSSEPTRNATNNPSSAGSSAQWPPQAQGRDRISSQDFQGQKLPQRLGLNEEWLTEEHVFEGKVLVVEFWASHSSPGRKVAKIHKALAEKYPEQLEVVAISGSEDKEKILKRYNDGKRPYTHLYDANETLFKALGFSTVPSAVVISTDGIIRWQGFPLVRGYEEAVEQIIAADPGL